MVAILLLVASAGCASSPPSADAPPRSDLTFGEPIVVGDYANTQSEAFIEVSPDGQTLLSCAHGEFKEPSPMYASTDSGANWSRLMAPAGIGIGGDCEVALSDKAWVFLHSTIAGATIAVTQDGGSTWYTNPLSALPTNGLADRPWISFVGDRLVMAYMPLWMQPGLIGVTTSDDLGRTWSVPVYANTLGPEETSTIHGPPILDPDGKTIRMGLIKIPPGTEPGQSAQVTFSFAVSTDSGTTWTEQPVDRRQAVFIHPSGACQGGDGTLYWPFYEEAEGAIDVKVLVSNDGGVTWGDPVLVLSGLSSLAIPWGDGRADGTCDVALAAEGSLVGGPEGLHIVLLRLDHDIPGLVMHARAINALESNPEFVTVDHDVAGRAYIVAPQAGGVFLADGHGTVTLLRES